MTKTPIEFVKSRMVIDSAGCWNWTGKMDANKSDLSQCRLQNDRGRSIGYGMVSVSTCKRLGVNERKAHRFSYTAFKGSIPDGMLVRHTCHNRKCVNPDHLLIGTRLDNASDFLHRCQMDDHDIEIVTQIAKSAIETIMHATKKSKSEVVFFLRHCCSF